MARGVLSALGEEYLPCRRSERGAHGAEEQGPREHGLSDVRTHPYYLPSHVKHANDGYARSYIIDHYASLPDNVLFIHPNRYQWHNDDPDYDGLPMLRHFQLPYLEKEGYVNIRCAWSLGCPNEIKPLAEAGEHREAVHAGGQYKKAFESLFPGEKVPDAVGVSCCAQFAATRDKIRERSKEQYEKYRDWILGTELGDAISGRVFEYSWHSKSTSAGISRPTPRPRPS